MTKIRSLRLKLGILILLVGSLACADGGWLVLPSVFYEREYSTVGAVESSRGHIFADGRVQYRWDSGFAVGGILSSLSGSGNNSYAVTQTALGATVSYLPGNWLVSVSYLPLLNRQEKLNGDKTTRDGGSGLFADGGYLFQVTDSILVGGILNFRQIVFTSQKVNTRDNQDFTYRQEEWRPMLATIFRL